MTTTTTTTCLDTNACRQNVQCNMQVLSWNRQLRLQPKHNLYAHRWKLRLLRKVHRRLYSARGVIACADDSTKPNEHNILQSNVRQWK